MLGTTGLHNRLLHWLRQDGYPQDHRHLQTMAWMILGLMLSRAIGLTRWSTFITSRARCAQSHQRRLRRWLSNPRIHPQTLYAPLIRTALKHWGFLPSISLSTPAFCGTHFASYSLPSYFAGALCRLLGG